MAASDFVSGRGGGIGVAAARSRISDGPPTKLFREIGQRMADARSGAMLSQREMALRLGVTRVTVWNWENGVVRPAIDSLYEFAVACGVDVRTFLPTIKPAREDGSA